VKRFSGWGYLAFTVWGLGMALTCAGWRLAALGVMELAFGLAWSREGLGPLRRVRFWVLLAAAVALGPWLVRKSGMTQAGVRLSWIGLSMGLEMAGRALTLTLAFSLGLSSLSLSDLVAIFDGLRLRGLGFALGVAVNLLGTLQEMARATFETIKLRGGLRRPIVALRLFLVTLVSNTLRYGDQVVQAASVRAFDPRRGRGGLVPHRADLWLVTALTACSVIGYLL
jgi:energy-coupling factor transporter transmembrane protein EcfT